jgi:hypothetical protein
MQQQNQVNLTASVALYEDDEAYYLTRFTTFDQALIILKALSKLQNQKLVYLDPEIPADIRNQLMLAAGEAPHNRITIPRSTGKDFGDTIILQSNNLTVREVAFPDKVTKPTRLLSTRSNSDNIFPLQTAPAGLLHALQTTLNPPQIPAVQGVAPVLVPMVVPVQAQAQAQAPVVQAPTRTSTNASRRRSIFTEETAVPANGNTTTPARTAPIQPLFPPTSSRTVLALLQQSEASKRALFSSSSISSTTAAQTQTQQTQTVSTVTAPIGRGSNQIGPININPALSAAEPRNIIRARRRNPGTQTTQPTPPTATSITTQSQPIVSSSNSNPSFIASRTRQASLRSTVASFDARDRAGVENLKSFKSGK